MADNPDKPKPDVTSGTGAGLMAFLDYLEDKGYGTRAAIHPLRSATKRVFETVEHGSFSDLDVRELAVDDYLSRFEILARGQLKHESLQAYRRRATRAIEAYREFLVDGKPPNFRRVGSKPQSDGGSATDASQRAKPRNVGGGGVGSVARSDRLIDFPFPLRSGELAHLHLPGRLDKVDADRLTGFLRSLQYEPQAELPERTGEEMEQEAA